MMHNFTFTDEELKCLQVCVSNAPIPYDITLKNIPSDILDKIGKPPIEIHEGEDLIKLDLSIYNERI